VFSAPRVKSLFLLGAQDAVKVKLAEVLGNFSRIERGFGSVPGIDPVRHTEEGHGGHVGIDIGHQGATEAEVDASRPEEETPELDFLDHGFIGIFAGYEQVVHRWSLLVQVGYYVAREEFDGQTPDLYQRLSVKYYFLKNTFAGLGVKFYEFSRAENLEWAIGQRWRW